MKYKKILYCLVITVSMLPGIVRTQTLPISTCYIGSIAVANPIIALLGSATMALSIIAHNAYQAYQSKQELCASNNSKIYHKKQSLLSGSLIKNVNMNKIKFSKI